MLVVLQAEHQANLRRISNKENLIQQNEALAKNLDLKRQNIAKMASTGLSLKERASEFNISTDMADSRTAYAISLYAKISNITWDYKSANGKLAGCKSCSISTFKCNILSSLFEVPLVYVAMWL